MKRGKTVLEPITIGVGFAPDWAELYRFFSDWLPHVLRVFLILKISVLLLHLKELKYPANFSIIFLQECHKNEVLLSKLKSLRIS